MGLRRAINLDGVPTAPLEKAKTYVALRQSMSSGEGEIRLHFEGDVELPDTLKHQKAEYVRTDLVTKDGAQVYVLKAPIIVPAGGYLPTPQAYHPTSSMHYHTATHDGPHYFSGYSGGIMSTGMFGGGGGGGGGNWGSGGAGGGGQSGSGGGGGHGNFLSTGGW